MPGPRLRESYVAFALILVVVLLQPLNGRSQTKIEWTPGAVPMGSQIGPLAGFPVVKGQPYTAEVLQQQITVSLDGTKQLAEAHNIHRRDSSGKLLDEKLPSPRVKQGDGETFTQHGFVLVDPVSMVWMQWDDDSRTAVVSSIHAQQRFMDAFDTPCLVVSGYANVEQQDLGGRTIHGVDVIGCRTTGVTTGEHPITVVIETWRSQALHIPLLTTEHDSKGTESRMEVTSLAVGEPDQTKFEPQQGYKTILVR
jgi:hypothetical protein